MSAFLEHHILNLPAFSDASYKPVYSVLLPTPLSLILYLCIGVLPFTGMSFNWVYRVSFFSLG